MVQPSICDSDAAWPLSNNSDKHLLSLFQDDTTLLGLDIQSTQFLALFKAAIILSQKYNITVNGKFLGWCIERTNGKAIDTLKSMCHVVSMSNVVGIVGPRLSRETHMIAAFAENIGILVVSYIATHFDLSSKKCTSCFLSDNSFRYGCCLSYRSIVQIIPLDIMRNYLPE